MEGSSLNDGMQVHVPREAREGCEHLMLMGNAPDPHLYSDPPTPNASVRCSATTDTSHTGKCIGCVAHKARACVCVCVCVCVCMCVCVYVPPAAKVSARRTPPAGALWLLAAPFLQLQGQPVTLPSVVGVEKLARSRPGSRGRLPLIEPPPLCSSTHPPRCHHAKVSDVRAAPAIRSDVCLSVHQSFSALIGSQLSSCLWPVVTMAK
jgi:hypothetical protein